MYKEYTRPLEQQIDTDKNIFSVLDERANRTPNDSLVEYKNEHGEWSSFSATEFRAKVIAIAKGLIAQGIMPGESVSDHLSHLLAVDCARRGHHVDRSAHRSRIRDEFSRAGQNDLQRRQRQNGVRRR